MANALLDKENSPFHEFSMEDDSAKVESVRSHLSHSTKPKSSHTPRASRRLFRASVEYTFNSYIFFKLDSLYIFATEY